MQVTNKHVKRCLTPLVFRKRQVKTTRKNNLTCPRWLKWKTLTAAVLAESELRTRVYDRSERNMVQPAWDEQWPNKVTARYSSRRNDTCPQTLVTKCQQQLYHDSQMTERAYVPMGTVYSYHAAIKGTNYWYGNSLAGSQNHCAEWKNPYPQGSTLHNSFISSARYNYIGKTSTQPVGEFTSLDASQRKEMIKNGIRELYGMMKCSVCTGVWVTWVCIC